MDPYRKEYSNSLYAEEAQVNISPETNSIIPDWRVIWVKLKSELFSIRIKTTW
jgi:hypothetical protein